MRLAKLLGLVVAACAVMVAMGAASASALTVTTCEGANFTTNCHTAPAGTTFTASSSNVKLVSSGITNTCSSSLTGKVTDDESTSSTDLITASITAASFTPCNVAPVDVANLPWTLETNKGEFPSGKVTGVHVTLTTFFGNCTFAEDATHTVTLTWTNGDPSTVTLGGSLALITGPCGSSGSITGTYTVKTVNGKTGNIVID